MTVQISARATKATEPGGTRPYDLRHRRPSRLPYLFMALLGGIALYFRSAEVDDPSASTPSARRAPSDPEADYGAASAPQDVAPDLRGSAFGFASDLRAGLGDRIARPGEDAALAEWLGPQGSAGGQPSVAGGPSFAALYGPGAGLAATPLDLAPGMVRPAIVGMDGRPPDPVPDFDTLGFGVAALVLDVPLA